MESLPPQLLHSGRKKKSSLPCECMLLLLLRAKLGVKTIRLPCPQGVLLGSTDGLH